MMSQQHFPALWVGKSEGFGSFTIGSTLPECSNITTKLFLMLFNKDIEIVFTDKMQNVNFALP